MLGTVKITDWYGDMTKNKLEKYSGIINLNIGDELKITENSHSAPWSGSQLIADVKISSGDESLYSGDHVLFADEERRELHVRLSRPSNSWDFVEYSVEKVGETVWIGEKPSKPRNLTVEIKKLPVRAILRWDKPTDTGGLPLQKYFVDCPEGRALSDDTWSICREIEHGNTYNFKVGARNAIGVTWSDTKTVTVGEENPLPNAPTNLNAKSVDNNDKIYLTWEGPYNTTTEEYIVYKDGEEFGRSSNRDLYDDYIQAGNTYTYRVAGRNAEGIGKKSDPVSITAEESSDVPTQPRSLNVEMSGDRAHLTWDIPSHSGVSRVKEYKVYRNGDELQTTSNREHYDSYVTVGETYSYRVAARNSAGWSDKTDSVSITIPSKPEKPSDPQNLSIGMSGDRVHLTWNKPADTGSSQIGEYAIIRNDNPNLANVTETEYYDSEVTAGQTYEYKVIASNDAGSSPGGNQVSMTIPSEPEPEKPSDPQNLSTEMSGDRVHLTWDKPADTGSSQIREYAITRNDNPNLANVTEREYYDSEVTVGQTYEYIVIASNDAGSSPGANMVSITIPSEQPEPGIWSRIKIFANENKVVLWSAGTASVVATAYLVHEKDKSK